MTQNSIASNIGQPPAALLREVSSQTSRTLAADFLPFQEALKTRFGASLDAIILYGSCLHSQDLKEGIVDFYVVVNDYRQAYRKRHLGLLNAWLAPNVFYLEIPGETFTLRAKYAVISMANFEKGTRDWFHSYLWARFAQPVRVLYARDATCHSQIERALAQSVLTFLKATVPALGDSQVNAEEIWTQGLTLAYAAELRPERSGRARQLTHLNMGDYIRLTALAAPALGPQFETLGHDVYQCHFESMARRRILRQWRLRRWQGRVLSVLRLSKATLTFAGCIDYAAWKIKRHTGVSVEITPHLRRHPLLWGLKVLWQLVRQGVVR
ncbi:MAG: hypothetical protein RQ899_08090 [Pseudomonadales bacterium]|nr:hypothetical protein [Pseudomonadales bacterium]